MISPLFFQTIEPSLFSRFGGTASPGSRVASAAVVNAFACNVAYSRMRFLILKDQNPEWSVAVAVQWYSVAGKQKIVFIDGSKEFFSQTDIHR